MGQELLPDLNRKTYLSNAASDFIELTRVHLMARGGDHLRIARARNSSGRVIDMIEKGAIAVGATNNPAYAALLQQLGEAFLGSLGLYSSFDTILQAGGFLRAPQLATKLSVVTLSASAYGVEEADPKPISKMEFSTSELARYKVVGIVVLTAELVKSMSPGASDLISTELRRAVGRATDDVFINLLIQNTGAESTPSTGTDAGSFLDDVASALSKISYGSTSRLFLIVPPPLYSKLILMRDAGGPIMVNGIIGSNIRVVPSDALTDTAILFDGTQTAVWAAGDIMMDQSESAATQ
jgi:hypothetical protein